MSRKHARKPKKPREFSVVAVTAPKGGSGRGTVVPTMGLTPAQVTHTIGAMSRAAYGDTPVGEKKSRRKNKRKSS